MIIFTTTVTVLLSCLSIVCAAEDKIQERNIISLDAAAQKMAGIVVTKLTPRELTKYVLAPGEVIPNADLTTKITSRVPAKVIRRNVQEGQHVNAGETLVVLSSVDVSKIQGDLILAAQEWQRIESLGKDAISAKRYSEANVAFQSAYQTALASGMSEAEITELLNNQKISQRKGEFVLTAPRAGTVFNVNITEGELAEPGRILLQIVDEKTVWVDAKLPPELAHTLKIGDKARIQIEGNAIEGHVIQVHHQLDETTRTRSIRIQVPNTHDLLHPGQFVNCQIQAGRTPPVLAVPVEAVIRTNNGDSAVYIEKKQGQFQQVEIKVLETIDNHAVIEGISSGTPVVTKGSFFIHAELNKKGFDPHNH